MDKECQGVIQNNHGENEMKIKTGFVSNSSSSSFIVTKDGLSMEQIESIRNHSEAKKYEFAESDPWDINEQDDVIILSTDMDNFDMRSYLKDIGVPDDNVENVEDTPDYAIMAGILESITEQMRITPSQRLMNLSKILLTLDKEDYSEYLSDHQKQKIEELEEGKKKAVMDADFDLAVELRDKIQDINNEAREEVLEKLNDNSIHYRYEIDKVIQNIKKEEINRQIEIVSEELNAAVEASDFNLAVELRDKRSVLQNELKENENKISEGI